MTAAARFMAKVVVSKSGCWEWAGARTKHPRNGTPAYGKFGVSGRHLLAHRYAWEAFRGAIPEGKNVLHRCDNPPCVNPDHLFLGTQSENMRDMFAKERASHSGEGHPAARLSADDIERIRAAFNAGRSQAAMARHFGVTPSHINNIVHGRAWRQRDSVHEENVHGTRRAIGSVQEQLRKGVREEGETSGEKEEEQGPEEARLLKGTGR